MSRRQTRGFAPEAASVPAARRSARAALTGWLGSTAAAEQADQVDLACLLVSEVATNALLHARSAFDLTLVLDGELLRVAVSDGSSMVPMRRRHAETAATGRGVGMVADLARDWGVEQLDAGKCVWFELLLPGAGADLPGARGTLAG